MEPIVSKDNQDAQNTFTDDKRPFYIWWFVILVNVIIYLGIVVADVYSGYKTVQNVIFAPQVLSYFIIIGISLLVTVIPTWISGSQKKWRHKVGYGIPILLLVPIPYFIYDWMTCTGKLCEVTGAFFTVILGSAAIVLAIFYTLGVFLRKWNIKVSKILVWIEAVIIAVGVAYLCYCSYLDFKLASLKESKITNVNEAVRVCDSLNNGRIYDCWTTVIKLNPVVDVCALSQSQKSKERCSLIQKNMDLNREFNKQY